MFTRQMYIIDFINNALFRRRNTAALSALLLLAMISTVNAATVNLTMEFIADLQQPQKNAFVNTTPVTGYCSRYPQYCGVGEFSIAIPGVSAEKYFDSTSDNIRNHTSMSLDGTARNIVLRDDKTGNQITGVFRLASFGVTHTSIDGYDLLKVMYLTSTNPQGGCSGRYGSVFGLGFSSYMGAWGVPEKKLTCYRKFDDPFQGNMRITDFSFGYTLEIPNPLGAYSGEYEGEVVYTVGEGEDIDVHAETISDSEIRIKIKATVRQAFQLEFPSDAEFIKVSLAPKGGWSQWANGGRVPDSLSQEVPFTLSSTSGFIVNMRCEHDSGTGCALRESTSPTGDEIPLEVSLTLPGFKTKGGSEVRNLLLNSLPAGHVILPPGGLVVHRRSQVDFKVRKPGVEMMVKSPGSTWRGAVTLVLDAQVD
ncbi:hypothetical protein [Cedecea lapagei]|uniref:hypothetical protein n=1 Tax=Cedecea lapagei TaxID=158823 RepID=UPI001BCBBBF7|nr:hypothetical protein [Cedecea lapagei]